MPIRRGNDSILPTIFCPRDLVTFAYNSAREIFLSSSNHRDKKTRSRHTSCNLSFVTCSNNLSSSKWIRAAKKLPINFIFHYSCPFTSIWYVIIFDWFRSETGFGKTRFSFFFFFFPFIDSRHETLQNLRSDKIVSTRHKFHSLENKSS